MTRLTIALVSCSIVVVAGCGPSASKSQREVASEPVATQRPLATPSGIETRPSSPLQVAALHRLDRAKVLIAKGDFLEAIADLEKTLAMDSTNPGTYLYLARAHHGLGNFRESLNFLEVAESLFEGDRASLAEVWVLKGDNLRGLGQRSQAQESYDRAAGFARQ